jgi:hypothetical protein
MQLNHDDLTELAHFLARRRTPSMEPCDAGKPDAEAWVRALNRAHDPGRLVRNVAQLHPEDPNLQAAAHLLAPRRRAPLMAGGLVLVAAVLLVATGGLAWGLAGVGSMTEEVTGVVVASAEAAEAVEDRALPEEPQANPASDVAEPVAVAAVEPPNDRALPERCAAGAGGVIGYWYAGSERPGTQGTVVRLDRDTNVRAAYPSGRNGFGLTDVRCVLLEGDEVVVSRDPIHVPADAWWVPLTLGDVRSAS